MIATGAIVSDTPFDADQVQPASLDLRLSNEAWRVRAVEQRPGDTTRLRPHTARGYCVPDHAWLLEYGRGPIPLMFPFALAGSMFVSLDARGLARSLLRYGALTARELLRGKL